VDSAGNAIVNERNAVANVTPGGTVKNLVKYASADGNVIWEQVFAVGNCVGAAPSALAVDNADNVIVTGDSFGHFLTAKFAATDGHLLWQQKAASGVFSGNFPAPFQSSTSGVGVDGAGNIVMTGESRTANGNLDFVTIKYAPSGNSSTTINCPANIVTGTDSGHCSAVVTFSATATDACGNAVPVTFSPASGSSFPKGTTTVTCSTADGSQCSFTVTVQNPIPAIAISGPPSGAVYPVGAPVTFTGSFTDNPGDTHSAQWLVDNFSLAGTVNEANGQVTATATFSSPGVYLVQLVIADSCGNTATANTIGGLPAMVVIYDPNGGFVTGGGWINSPAGAYVAQPTLTGKASFGFVSNYQKGATVPTGETEFQFQVANFNFHGTSYEWLVISGARAQYKGSGTVNGAGNYGFILTAIDGDVKGGGGVDKFRIKIWDKATGTGIYDNQLGASDSADPTTAIGGGSIVIH